MKSIFDADSSKSELSICEAQKARMRTRYTSDICAARRNQRRQAFAFVAVLSSILGVCLFALPQAGATVTNGVISNTAPLARISLHNSFSQQVVHAEVAKGKGAFYQPFKIDNPDNSYVRVFSEPTGGTVLTFPAGQQDSGGDGSFSDPYFLQTSATSTANPAGITMTDRLSYVNGDSYFRNEVTLTNNTESPETLNFYRWADCVLAGSDKGVSNTPTRSADCHNGESSLSLIPVTSGAKLQSGSHSATRTRVNSNLGLTDECLNGNGKVLEDAACETSTQDNGFALEYADLSLQPGESVTVSYMTDYAASRPKFADLQPNTTGVPSAVLLGETFTYRLTVTNSGPDPAPDASVIAPIPDGLEFISAKGAGKYNKTDGVWTLGNMAAGTSLSTDISVGASSLGTAQLGVTHAQSTNIDNSPCVPGNVEACGLQPQVRVSQASPAHSSYSITDGERVANGTDSHTVTVSIRTTEDDPVDGLAGALSVEASPGKGITTSAFTATKNPGEYHAQMTSTTAGPQSLTVSLGNAEIPPTEGNLAHFVAGPLSQGDSLVKISDGSRIADGIQSHEVVITLRDAHGNPLSGKASELGIDLPDGLEAEFLGETAEPGVYRIRVRSTLAGKHDITMSFEGVEVGATTADFQPGPMDFDLSRIEPLTFGSRIVSDPEQVIADDFDHVHDVRVTLVDENNNPIAGEQVDFLVPPSLAAVQSETTKVTTSDGTATLSVATRVAGEYFITASTKDGNLISGSPVSVVFDPDEVGFGEGHSRIEGSAGGVEANGLAEHTITVTASDRFGNHIPGASVAVTLPEEISVVGSAPTVGVTDEDGQFILTVTSLVAGTYQITAEINGSPITNGSPTTVQFKAGAASAANSTFEVTPGGPVMVGEDYTVTVTLRDAQGNLIQDEEIGFALSQNLNIIEDGPYLTNTNGQLVLHARSTKAGTNSITATIGTETIGNQEELEFTPGPPDLNQAHSNIKRTTDQATITADGTTTHEVTATIVDQYDNPIPKVDIDFTFPKEIKLAHGTTAQITTNPDGQATLQVTSTTAGTYQITAEINGSPITNGSPTTVEFQAKPLGSNATLSPPGKVIFGTLPISGVNPVICTLAASAFLLSIGIVGIVLRRRLKSTEPVK